MNPILWLVLTVINLYIWIIIAGAILSWLFAFNIINAGNSFVRQIAYTIDALTEPLLGPIRRVLPNLGGIDISPVILILGLLFLERMIVYYVAGAL
ncbi:YggT family protein [Kaustia mangrovi]|uniref:YggT family protein n=1 Tax=Kaustia mangrovi TaxID=2593653 RepID=A0A7S8C2P6_9HYPH|nr:YggT family protein [Kaustia mangrovi]QPC42263.1 YggT family protein [Kaustia mangrovi]